MDNDYIELEQALTKNIYKEIIKRTNFSTLEEIRLRVNQPVILKSRTFGEIILENLKVSIKELKEIFQSMTNYSAYAYEESIKNGYLTLKGGHRVGLAGEIKENNGKIVTINRITFLNIRISHEINKCSKDILKKIINKEGIYNTLIISPPGYGKTTLLRDLIKEISNNIMGVNICVIDERSEISGEYRGEPQIDLGKRTDVISNCNKKDGIIMAIRSMTPTIIATDEVGEKTDIEILRYAMKSGVSILATVHGKNIAEVMDKFGNEFKNLFEKNIVIIKKGEYICI